MNRWLGLSFACCFAAVSSSSLPAAASEPEASVQRQEYQGYSALEKSIIEQALSRAGLSWESAPEGKLIEDVRIVSLDVFDERDPVPDFVNVLHATTSEHVIRRELLFQEGEPYRSAFVNETARNMRGLQQLSVVLLVPVQGSRPDRVRVADPPLSRSRGALRVRRTARIPRTTRGDPLRHVRCRVHARG